MCPVLSRFCLNFTEIPVRCLSVRIFIKRRSDFWLLDFCLNFIHCQDCVRFSKKPYPLFVCPAGQGRDRRSVTELFGFSVLVSADVWHISLSPEAKQNICQDCWINCSRWTYSPKDRPQPKQFYTKKGSKANNLRVITKMTVIFENDFHSVPKWINPYLAHFGNIQERHLWKKKSKIYFLISDDVIHGRLFMTSHKSETTPVRLTLCHMT